MCHGQRKRGTFRAMIFRAAPTFAWMVLAAVNLISCGPPAGMVGGPLVHVGPFLEGTQSPIRQVVLTHHRPPATLGERRTCVANALFFDPVDANARSRNPIAREGECVLYPPPVDLLIAQQRWLCLGLLRITAGGSTETIAFCPSAMIGMVGADGLNVPFNDCDALTAGSMVSASSMDEIDGDQLDDFDLSVAMPSPVTITAPNASPIGPWPPTGDVGIRWQSSGATSAIVTVTARDPSVVSTTIVCLPRTNGVVFLPTALLEQSQLRTREARVTVASYSDAIRPETGSTPAYRLSAGFSTTAILQPNR